jgi:hypothetical protein
VRSPVHISVARTLPRAPAPAACVQHGLRGAYSAAREGGEAQARIIASLGSRPSEAARAQADHAGSWVASRERFRCVGRDGLLWLAATAPRGGSKAAPPGDPGFSASRCH